MIKWIAKCFKIVNNYVQEQKYRNNMMMNTEVCYDEESGCFLFKDAMNGSNGPFICKYEAEEARRQYVDDFVNFMMERFRQ